MKTPTDELDRLEMAVSAVMVEGHNLNWRGLRLIVLLKIAAVFGILFLRDNLFVLFMFSVLSCCLAVCFWIDWRYRLFVPAFWSFGVSTGFLLLQSTVFEVRFRTVMGVALAALGYTYTREAISLAIVNGPGWERELSLADSWWQRLTSPEKQKDVMEFSKQSRWWGYTSLRLLKHGQYWVAMRFREHGWGNLSPVEFSIRYPSEVEFLPQPDGEMKVRIGKRSFRASNMTPPNPVGV